MESWASKGTSIHNVDSACFGRNLDDLLPEDRFDQQPLLSSDGRQVFVADVRIDNRDEAAASLGLGERVRELSDADILFEAWQLWGPGLFAKVLGSYSGAIWRRGTEALTLIRSPFADKPLFYCSRSDTLAFASSPFALYATGLADKGFLPDAAARMAVGQGFGVTRILSGVELVGHGEIVRVHRTGRISSERWFPQRHSVPTRRVEEAGELLRHELDRAVTAQLRRSNGRVTALLSSGRDSGAVATSAALTLERSGERLLCITGAPRSGFRSPRMPHHVADESAVAAQIAYRFSNIDHIIARPRRLDVGSVLDELHRHHFLPMLNPSQLPWWEEMERTAKQAGTGILLSAGGGNFSVSLGGVEFLGDALLELGTVRTLGLSLRSIGRRPRHATALLRHALAPRLPAGIYKMIERASGRRRVPVSAPLLRQPYRTAIEAELMSEQADAQPMAAYRNYRCELLMKRDYPDILYRARWGYDHRDPTLDTRLVEICLSMPAGFLFAGSSERPAFDAAFRTRLPSSVLRSSRRGLQSADWREHFIPNQLRGAFDRYSSSAAVQQIFDFSKIDRWVERPSEADLPQLVSALSVASFLWVHFPD